MMDMLLIGSLLGLAGIAGGWFWGYHSGLKRASEAIWEGCQEQAKVISSLPPVPEREKTIKECIATVLAIRPSEPYPGTVSMEDQNRAMWHRLGVDDAIDALRRMDKRGGGHYDMSHSIVDLRSRLALDREERRERKG